MSTPPGGWPPPQQSGPPHQGQPYGQPAYNPQQQPPAGWQQAGWPQSAPPPKPTNTLKWLLIGVAVLLVIGITVGATLLMTRDDAGGGTNGPTSAATSDFASANDTGPVSVVTDEPTCNTFNGINNSLSDVQKNGWGDERQTLGPQSQWTPDQRSRVEAVATAMRNSADQMTALAKQTPHRFVRELYEQFIAYARAYADSIPSYTPADDALASANINISGAIFGICNSIQTGAANRSISIGAGPPPVDPRNSTSLPNPERFVSNSDQICVEWTQSSDRFDAGTVEWQKLDTATPASQWTPERRALEQAALPYLTTWAEEMQANGSKSGNPVLDDFANAANLYMRAFISVGDNYIGSDSWLSWVGFRLNQTILAGCRAAG